MDRRTIHRIAIVFLVLVGLLAAAYVTFALTIGRSVLEGESRHDFGIVLIESPNSTFEHTFHLTNDSDETVVIESAKPSCSCTTAELSTRTIEPGGSIDITARMTLRASAHRKISITLNLRDGDFHNVWVEANGRLRQQLKSTAAFLRVGPGSPAMNVVWVEVWDDTENAPTPTLVTPDGVTAKFTRWDLHRKGNERHGLPAQWSGRIEVEQQSEALPPGAAMTVQFKSNEPVTVYLAPAIPPPGNPAESAPGDR
ncbi:MAG: DUF1573 domain-containing protein [Phycisphaerales bacterium]